MLSKSDSSSICSLVLKTFSPLTGRINSPFSGIKLVNILPVLLSGVIGVKGMKALIEGIVKPACTEGGIV
ncbi:MAG: hypothetical protein ACD_24C00234G0001, partial [uncultured bacterium]